MKDANNRGSWGWGVWEHSVLSSQFSCKSKTTLKYKSTKKQRRLISMKNKDFTDQYEKIVRSKPTGGKTNKEINE